MADTQSRFAELPTRQKATVVIFLLIAIFGVWEIIGLIRGNSHSSSVSPAIAAVKPTAPAMSAVPPKPSMSQSLPTATKPPAPPELPKPMKPDFTPSHLPSAPPPKTAASKSPDLSRPTIEPELPQTEFLVQQEQIQGKYVAALNDLQMLKIQKEIAETSQAIIAAKLATATAEKSISDLLAEAEASTALPPSAGKKGAGGLAPNSANISPQAPPPLEQFEGSYSIQSVSMEQDQWHAVVKYKDKLYDVSVGDMLPPDRSIVKSIDQKGVTLDTAGMEQTIPMTVTDNDASTSSKKEGPPGGSAPSEAPSSSSDLAPPSP